MVNLKFVVKNIYEDKNSLVSLWLEYRIVRIVILASIHSIEIFWTNEKCFEQFK